MVPVPKSKKNHIFQVHGQFWETWRDFEVKHGNEDTIREMLRIKRSVQATYSTNVNYMSAQMIAAVGAVKLPGETPTAADSMAVLEAKAQLVAEQQKAGSGGNIAFIRGASKTTQLNTTENPDEIDIDGEDEEEEEDTTGFGVFLAFLKQNVQKSRPRRCQQQSSATSSRKKKTDHKKGSNLSSLFRLKYSVFLADFFGRGRHLRRILSGVNSAGLESERHQ